MGLLIAIIFGGILLPIVVNLLSNELYDRAPSFARWLINRAVRQLPESERALRQEEWEAHLDQCHGKLGQVRHALGCVVAGARLAGGPIPLQGRIVKRALDLLIILPLVPLIMFITVLCAALIRVQSPGPALFVQERLGRRNARIRILTLRMMYVDADVHAQSASNGVTEHADPRLTPVGIWFRRLGLDRLPMLWSVINGDMTLVGPHPYPVVLTEFLTKFPAFSARSEVKPGLVSLSDARPILYELDPLYEVVTEDLVSRIAADVTYVSSWSLRLDLRILVSILKKSLKPRKSRRH